MLRKFMGLKQRSKNTGSQKKRAWIFPGPRLACVASYMNIFIIVGSSALHYGCFMRDRIISKNPNGFIWTGARSPVATAFNGKKQAWDSNVFLIYMGISRQKSKSGYQSRSMLLQSFFYFIINKS